MSVIFLESWFKERGIDYVWACGMARKIKACFPVLAASVKNGPVEGELELIQLIYQVIEKKFPVEFYKTDVVIQPTRSIKSINVQFTVSKE